mmetsp:Transcript_37716/g.80146  ORF Transcript_37716/g.80146 Transcript_37716/m.80146 type:complete len:239 (+) Transcript_37716:364-1080(+)
MEALQGVVPRGACDEVRVLVLHYLLDRVSPFRVVRVQPDLVEEFGILHCSSTQHLAVILDELILEETELVYILLPREAGGVPIGRLCARSNHPGKATSLATGIRASAEVLGNVQVPLALERLNSGHAREILGVASGGQIPQELLTRLEATSPEDGHLPHLISAAGIGPVLQQPPDHTSAAVVSRIEQRRLPAELIPVLDVALSGDEQVHTLHRMRLRQVVQSGLPSPVLLRTLEAMLV